MTSRCLYRRLGLAILALAVAVGFSSLAVAQRDDDDYGPYASSRANPRQAHDYGYQNGYRDGLRKGRHEGRENYPDDFRSEEWRNASNGYESWMGPFGAFRDGYRDGYRDGFRAGFQRVQGGDYDDDAYYPGQPPYRVPVNNNPRWYGGNTGYSVGYRDGSSVAREDLANGKPYNPNPRGRYDDEDHGYRSEYGSKSAYKSQYASGYRDGYASAFGRRY